ncbi:MAG: hypothetical protein FWG16_06465, partial [Micrococcales bacterium]|nr:hypothetical protein [Micrococcales bacterium]
MTGTALIHRRRQVPAVLVLVIALLAGLTADLGVAHLAGAVETRDEIEQKRAANQDALNQLEAELEGTSAELAKSYLELETANKELPLAQATMELAQQDYAAAQQEYQEVSDKLTAAQTQHEQVSDLLERDQAEAEQARRSIGQMARSVMVADNSNTNDLLVLLGAVDLAEAATAQMTAQAFSLSREAALTKAQQSAGVNINRRERLSAVSQEIAELKALATAA